MYPFEISTQQIVWKVNILIRKVYFTKIYRYNQGDGCLLLEVLKMNLVFSFDEGYANTFRVLMQSIFQNHSSKHFTVYVLHDEMPENVLLEIQEDMDSYQYSFRPINCRNYLQQSESFRINRYYTVEMYLWLYAPDLLPETVERALYLDPDIINLNSIEEFYAQDFNNHLFIAMDYKIKNRLIQPINNLRLGTRAAENYFNSGVVLMNIAKLREERVTKEITDAVIENKAVLILPDQDIFNHLYHGEIKEADWEIYNVDHRLYQLFHLINPDRYNLNWVEEEVVFIHYTGKHKPWIERENYRYDLGVYYFKYESLLTNNYKERESEQFNDRAF